MPTYTKEQFAEMKRKELTPVKYGEKEYTKYEALQRQRRLETKMRAQRREIQLLKEGGAHENDLIAARSRYRGTSREYTQFSKAMGLPQQRERVYIDNKGNIGQGKYTKPVAKSEKSGIIKKGRDITVRNLPNGSRTSKFHTLSEEEISNLKTDIIAIGADENIFKFNQGFQTCYIDELDIICVKGDVLPDVYSIHPRDLMSSRAVLAHEYYGHRAYRGTKLSPHSWIDEFRASYMAAKNCPNLSDDDRKYLILDAIERAKESGVSIKYNDFMRRYLYGS